MRNEVERRQAWHRIIGVERRNAPFSTIMGRPLPDPTQLEDEDFHDPYPRWLRDEEPGEDLGDKPH